MRRPFAILNVLGDVLDDGELRFVEDAKTLEAARRRITALGESHPGEFVIYNQQTGERVSMKIEAEGRPATWLSRVGHGFLVEAAQGKWNKPIRRTVKWWRPFKP